ncbi:MAG: UDP-N-acetylglucosamine--N-acetylmuramyl-(pentapeptide) pyrophosphoryl-undecaprenol N-acetylglucosamine transferase [bacterium]|nr:UDP-N-acetylglucosamine--N-acetylmuramyl-(pentapeptide) pyrophosphoryl-undecaprenol N-acetylglucosamine transferase [bacterium]
MKKIRILITGGGSGGHIYPLIAVIEELKKLIEVSGATLDARYFGNPGHYSLELQGIGVRVTRVAGSKLRRYFSFMNIVDFFKFAWSIPQALWKVFWFMPDVAFSKGGPGAIAIVNACAFYRVPIVIHDSDAVPGLTSRVTARVAKIIELAFPSGAEYVSAYAERVKAPGNPVRSAMRPEEAPQSGAAHEAKLTMKFAPELPLLLVIGGSQGAEIINNFILENLPAILSRYQVLHQVGVDLYDAHIATYNTVTKPQLEAELARRYRVVPFFGTDFRQALTAADLVISRAGAGALFEIAAWGKPSLIIPLTNAAYDHQRENAFQYREVGACLVIEEENLIGNLVLAEIDGLFANPERLKKMAINATKFYKPDAATNIAKDILSLL